MSLSLFELTSWLSVRFSGSVLLSDAGLNIREKLSKGQASQQEVRQLQLISDELLRRKLKVETPAASEAPTVPDKDKV